MQQELERILGRTSPPVAWTATIMHGDRMCASFAPDRELGSASVGKIFLLAAVSRAIHAGSLSREARIAAESEDLVADSGLWQFFSGEALTVETLASLVGAVSDNLATNVLLRTIGLQSVQQVSMDVGVPNTRMLDRIRDVRSSEHPYAPSQSRSGDLAMVLHAVSEGTLISRQVAKDVEHWLSLNSDLSMVAAAFDLDPLAHADATGGARFFNKTGTDTGVRADTGHIDYGRGGWTYAVVANWDGRSAEIPEVMKGMRSVGQLVLDASRDQS